MGIINVILSCVKTLIIVFFYIYKKLIPNGIDDDEKE